MTAEFGGGITGIGVGISNRYQHEPSKQDFGLKKYLLDRLQEVDQGGALVGAGVGGLIVTLKSDLPKPIKAVGLGASAVSAAVEILDFALDIDELVRTRYSAAEGNAEVTERGL